MKNTIKEIFSEILNSYTDIIDFAIQIPFFILGAIVFIITIFGIPVILYLALRYSLWYGLLIFIHPIFTGIFSWGIKSNSR